MLTRNKYLVRVSDAIYYFQCPRRAQAFVRALGNTKFKVEAL